MTNRPAIKAELAVLVPVFDKVGVLKHFDLENAHYHSQVPANKRIKLDDSLLVARMLRDFSKSIKVNPYAIWLPEGPKPAAGDWKQISLEKAIDAAEKGERSLVIDTQRFGLAKEGENYRERKLRLHLRLAAEKPAKKGIAADDYFDVAAFYTQKTKK